MTKNSSSQLSTACFFFLSIALGGKAFATEPLHDQYLVGAQSGLIFPSECCWMKLPPSQRLTDMKRAELGCSAIGGPVGKFKLESGKLWLTGLLKCGGDVSLREVYPDLEGPALATWLTGTFNTQVEFLCYENPVRPVYSLQQVLTIEKGIVTSLSETRTDASICQKHSRS